MKASALCLRAKITFGLFHLMIISKTAFARLEKAWIDLVKAWTSATQFVPNTVILEESGTCTVFKFVTYLLMTRFRKNLKILPPGCFDVPDEALESALPVSPPEKTHNLRKSTLEKSEVCRQEMQERELEKIKKNSQKFIEAVDFDHKVLFTELRASSPAHLFKGRLKRNLQISRKYDKKKRNAIFEKLKNEKIERFGLQKYGTEFENFDT